MREFTSITRNLVAGEVMGIGVGKECYCYFDEFTQHQAALFIFLAVLSLNRKEISFPLQ